MCITEEGVVMNLENMWKSFLERIKNKISNISYETWFSETKLIDLTENKAIVQVPYHVHKKNLSENYIDIIEETFQEVTGTNFKFEFLLEEEVEKNIEINTEDIGIPSNETFTTNLDSRYSFENYIIGKSNKFAATSAIAVAEHPGKMYNPLFIYGPSGLGKTHLMQAIGIFVVKNTAKRVLYITCDNFLNDFVEICRKNGASDNFEVTKQFKSKYRDVDVLIIDDIHNIVGATSAQQEFFNTFNDLYNNEKQIIISSDRSPDDIKRLEERLKTRFNWGLTVSIEPPDFELRMNIINKKIENHELKTNFPEDVKEYIASNCMSDIRKLEGALTRVFAYATIMNGSDINLELATEALKDYFVTRIEAKNNIEQVMHIVCSNYNVSVDDLKSKRRISTITQPRQVAMYICRMYLNENLVKIGNEFGGRNHTTVMHGVDKIKKEVDKSDELKNEIQKMVNQIKMF